eukprot:119099-Pyramimonas_sp.AAC.1
MERSTVRNSEASGPMARTRPAVGIAMPRRAPRCRNPFRRPGAPGAIRNLSRRQLRLGRGEAGQREWDRNI